MQPFSSLTADEQASLLDNLKQRFEQFREENLALDMTRGKPCPDQLDLSLDMLTKITPDDFKSPSGMDTRNYGGLDGLPEAKAFFAEYLGVATDEVIVGGNSSLALMHDTVVNALLHGVPDSTEAWSKLPKVKFLCPSPGYDRHFAICEHKGIDMIPIPYTDNGPDMAEVEILAGSDDSIRGIWCVPKYSNPTGITYSSETVKKLAGMKTAAADFRIFWDNAYAVHDLGEETEPLENILSDCKEAGNPNRVFMFGSTSKISFAGAGLSAMAGSSANMEWMKLHLSKQTIGYDKINQLRHLRFFPNMQTLHAHMKKHASIIRPKFEAVDQKLTEALGMHDIATWSNPRGGYFISLDTLPHCAQNVVKMAASVGVKLTSAGATFPYGKDPKDQNIRIAPTLPSLDEIEKAMDVVTTCIQIVSLQKLKQG